MEIRPIFSALMRSKIGPVLLGLEIALTLAVLVNGAYVTQQRMEHIDRDVGTDIANQFGISFVPLADMGDEGDIVERDLAELRSMDGVRAVSATNTYPVSGGGWSSTIETEPDSEDGTELGLYWTGVGGPEAFGVSIVAGRSFNADEAGYLLPQQRDNTILAAILSRESAQAMWPDDDPLNAVGKNIYMGEDAVPVVGIMDRLMTAWPWWIPDRSIMLPNIIQGGSYSYMVRTEPGRRDEMMPLVEARLAELNSQRVIRGVRTMEEVKARTYEDDRAMAVLMVTVVALLLAITATGVVGLASFNVNQRRKQIGTRRALGATRFNIVRYFLVENVLITSGGIALGLVLSILVNMQLIEHFNAPKLPVIYPLTGAVVVMMLGVAAAYWPARRASRVPPAVATRTV